MDNKRGLVWFRNDLRTEDNPALYHAGQNCNELIAIYLIDEPAMLSHHEAACKVDFLLRNLACLSEQLAKLNIALIIKHDSQDCTKEILNFANEQHIQALYFNNQYEWDERKRDERVEKIFKQAQFEVQRFDDQVILAPSVLLNQSQEPIKVFSAFARKWWQQVSLNDFDVLPKPIAKKQMLLSPSKIPKAIGSFKSEVPGELWKAGEAAAHHKLQNFIEDGLSRYHETRDNPRCQSSHISPYLALGVISGKQCFHLVMQDLEVKFPSESLNQPGAASWFNELIWREFFKYLLFFHPELCKHQAFKKDMDLPWKMNKTYFYAWCTGQTGFPFIDAAMRQLKATGWISNRARMIVAMFLCKILLIDWRAGERYFMEHLIDGDFSANNGNWQWCASTGTDSVPYFRIFNPTTQSKKCDAEGVWIKQWCPELSKFDAKSIHEPYNQNPLLAQSCGYPEPIVDYKKQRGLVLALYKRKS